MTYDEYAKKYGTQLKAVAYDLQKKEEKARKEKEAEAQKKKEDAEKNKRTWFQKGAFEDGYQFGDVTRTVIGTGMDVAEELEEGILEMGEKAIDAGAYVAGGIGGLFGAEDFQNRTADFIKKDLYNSEEIIKRGNEYNPFSLALKAMGTDTESASLLGDRSESLVNSAGQLAAQYGLTMVGVPWFVTSGVTNFGGEVESSLNQGASYGEAGMSAAISTGAEILTEKLFGGDLFTKSGGFDAAVDALTKNISHKFVQKATKFGLNALGEGAEEWLSTRIGQFGQWLSYQRKQDEKGLFQMLYSEEAIDEAIESFLGGTILGFGQGGVKTGSQRNSSTQDSQADAQSEETASDKSVEVQTQAGAEGTQEAVEAKPGTLEWVKEIADLGAGKDTQKNAASGETTITVKSAGSAINENSMQKNTLAYTLASNLDAVRDMEPVSNLTGREFNNRGMKLSDQIRDFFKSIGNKVFRKDLGDVELGEYGVGGVINHRPINRAKAVSIAAVPDVIQNGRQISYDPNWKGRGYESYTFAAPVSVNGTEVYVAAVVNRLPNNKFYLSEMVDSEGNYVRIDESPSGNSKNGLPMGLEDQQVRDYAGPEGLSEGGSPSTMSAEPTPLFINNIPQNRENVNTKSAETESVGAAPEGFTGKQGYYDQLTDENSQPDRPGDVRPMEVLKKDRYGRRVTEFSANAYGAEITSDQMADQIQELIDEGALGFDTRSNPESMQKAADDIREKGYTKVRRDITANVANGRLQDGDIEKAMLLYAAYANRKGQAAQDNAAELMVDLATMANMSGRNLQLFRMLRKLTPEGQRMSIQKTIDRYVEQLNKKRSDKNQAQVEIPQELMDKYEEAARKDLTEQTAETEKEKAKIEQEIYKVAASQIKASFVEKLNAWRYMAMLGNVKTQARNVAGNLSFRPLVNVKRTVGAAIESVTLEKSQRTKSVLGVGAEAKALRQWAREDAKGMDAKKLLSYTARTGDSAKSQIEDARAIYDNKALEATREFIQKVPEAADMVFKRWEYEVSLASFLKARGYTTADITGGKVSEDILNEAREYAALEAMKATFNDRNIVSDALVNLRYKGDNKALKALNILAEGVMPFRRTPANIAVRAVEYSPVNIARGALNLATKVRNGNMSAATAIDQISSGLTGTGAMVLGYALASGIFGFKLKGHLDDEDEKNAGHQAYALEIGGKSYSINWLAPTNIPLFIGANIYQNSQEDAQDISWFANFANASVNALEPMLELSCMSSLQDWIEDMKYAQSGTEIYTAISSAATNYMSQYIPTLFGQVERAVEGEKKQVYADGDTPLERSIQKTIGYATQKLPGDAFQTQKYDQWGNPVEKDNWFDALINPSSVKEISTDPLDAEVSRLNGAQGKYNVTANKPSQTVSYTDADGVKHEKERLTGEQWEKLQAVYGQTSYKVMSGMIQSEDYTALPDELKAKAFDLAYEYATELGREQALKGQYTRDLPKWMEGLDGAGQDVADAILRYVWTGTTSKYTELSMQDASDVMELLDSLLAESGYTNVRGVQKVEAIVAADDFLTEKEQTEVLKDTLDDKAWDKYQQILKLGLDNDDYAASYRLYLDTTGSGKKERTIKAFQKELGVSYNTAKALYEIYNPSKKAAS